MSGIQVESYRESKFLYTTLSIVLNNKEQDESNYFSVTYISIISVYHNDSVREYHMRFDLSAGI